MQSVIVLHQDGGHQHNERLWRLPHQHRRWQRGLLTLCLVFGAIDHENTLLQAVANVPGSRQGPLMACSNGFIWVTQNVCRSSTLRRFTGAKAMLSAALLAFWPICGGVCCVVVLAPLCVLGTTLQTAYIRTGEAHRPLVRLGWSLVIQCGAGASPSYPASPGTCVRMLCSNARNDLAFALLQGPPISISPGARGGAGADCDAQGNFWVWGGASGTPDYSDLWQFVPSSGQVPKVSSWLCD